MKKPKLSQPESKTPEQPAAAPSQAQSNGSKLLTLEEAIAVLKTTRPTFYRWLREGKIKGLKIGRQWRFQKEDVERFVTGQRPRIDLPVSPRPLIDHLKGQLAKLGQKVPAGLAPEDPLAEAVHLMILLAWHQRASDIHVAANHLAISQEGKNWAAVIRNRVDGVLHVVAEFDLRLLPAVVERWKILAGMNTTEKRIPQDGKAIVSISGKELDIRVCVLPAALGESLTARLLAPATAPNQDLSTFGFSPKDLQRLTEAVKQPAGVVICNGPTGCGKTTTLYSCMYMLSGPEHKLVTIEDPIEYFFPWMVQCQISEPAGFTFARAIRAALRSDPDVIMVGEIRDGEIANICIQCALTGHMVLTTLHAQDSAAALQRLVEIGVPGFLVADTAGLIVSQRLVRRLCPDCAKPAVLTAEEESLMAQAAINGGLAIHDLARDFRQPVGCPKCGNLGFRGRTLIAETLKMTPAVAHALREKAPVDELRRLAVRDGMTTMAADGVRKSASGVTTLREVRQCLSLGTMT